MKFLTLFLCLCATTPVLASTSYYRFNPEDRFDLEFLWATEQTKDSVTKEVDGTYTKADVSLLYHLNPQYDVRFFVSSVLMTYEEEENDYGLDLAEVMIRDNKFLKNIFPNSNISLELKSYYLLDDEKRERYGFTGAFIPQLIINNRLSRKVSLETRIRRHFYYHDNEDATLRHEDRIYFTPYYFLNRKNFLGLQFNYRHKTYGKEYFSYRTFTTQKKENEIFKVHPSFMHLLNDKTLLEFYVETYLSNTADKRDIEQIAEDEFVVGFSAFIQAF
mgnify:CR=1 FL=1